MRKLQPMEKVFVSLLIFDLKVHFTLCHYVIRCDIFSPKQGSSTCYSQILVNLWTINNFLKFSNIMANVKSHKLLLIFCFIWWKMNVTCSTCRMKYSTHFFLSSTTGLWSLTINLDKLTHINRSRVYILHSIFCFFLYEMLIYEMKHSLQKFQISFDSGHHHQQVIRVSRIFVV